MGKTKPNPQALKLRQYIYDWMKANLKCDFKKFRIKKIGVGTIEFVITGKANEPEAEWLEGATIEIHVEKAR